MTETIQTIENIVSVNDGKAVTDSLKVAQVFGKKHKDVLKAIRDLEIPEDLRRRNFAPSSFIQKMPNGGTKEVQSFTLARDGFTLLAFGFTSRKAMQFKIAYIEAFNRMEARLNGTMKPEEVLKDKIAEFGADWILERVQRCEIYDHFYAPKHQLGERNAKGFECSTIRRAANPVKGGRIPSGRERAIITQPHLFGYSLLIKMNKQIGE